MPQFTKQAIVRSFIELLNERPLDKITVIDIADRCGINRNTFYYYFQDIYALVDEMFRTESERIINEHRVYKTWQEGFMEAVSFALENKTAIYHIYNSVNRDRLEEYLFDVAITTMTEFISDQAEGLDVADEDIRDLSIFYTAALEGLVMGWLRNGMKEDPESYIKNMGRLLDGNIRVSLENVSKKPKAKDE